MLKSKYKIVYIHTTITFFAVLLFDFICQVLW